MTIVAGLKKQRLRRAVFYEVLRKTLCHSRLFQPLSASFASVLGGVYTTITSEDDLDNITGTGIYKFTASTPQNSPIEMGVVFVVSAYLATGIYGIIQFASDTRGGRNKEKIVPIYYRVAWTNATNGWSKWAMINTTDV